MHRIAFLSVLLLGSCFADVTTWNNDQTTGYRLNHLDNIKGLHYSQHDASVQAARKGAAERLARIGSSPLVDPCGTLCTGISDGSDAETLGQGIVGFTSSGSSGSGSSSSSSKYQASSRQESSVHGVQPLVGGSKSSYVSSSHRQSSASVSSGGQPVNHIFDSEGVKTRSNFGAASGATVVQPVYSAAYPIGQEAHSNSYSSSANRKSSTAAYHVPVDTGSSYSSRSNFAASSESASIQQPVIPVYSSSEQAAKYVASGRQDGYQRYSPSGTYVIYSKPVPVYTSNFDTSARFSDAQGNIYGPVKVVYPSRTSSQQSTAEEQQYSSIAGTQQPVQIASHGDHAAQSTANYRASYRPVYQPVYSSHSASSERAAESQVRTSDIIASPVVSSTSNRLDERQEDFARRGSIYTPIPHNQGATVSKYSTFDQQNAQAGSSYGAIAAPVGVSSSESASKYSAQQQHQQRASYTPIAVQPVAHSSQYSAQEQNRQQASTSTGGSYYPISQGRYSAADSQQSTYRHQQASKAGSSFHHQQQYPITNDALGMRFGATGMEFGDNNDLSGLMSESERLAKLQAKNAYNGAVSGSSAIETENRFGGGVDGDGTGSSAGLGSGAFQRTKSWSSSSKWASGQKFGEDGNIKSYSSLSTAESEQHNVNGKKTGYKAATTTLEDDGKVSTYSLHTP